MAGTWKTVRVFISSTFRDMQAERDHLVRVVFPELRERLYHHRIYLEEIDLRWGITKEQSENEQTLELCLNTIDECRPFFLGILGDRYGAIIEGAGRNDLRSRGLDTSGHASVTELEFLYGALNSGAPGHAFFFFRDSAVLEQIPSPLRRSIYEETGAAARARLAELKQRVTQSGHFVAAYKADWDPGTPDPANGVKGRLVSLEGFGIEVRDALWGSIEKEMGLEPGRGTAPADPLDEEREFHSRFAESRLRVFAGRREPLKALLNYAASDADRLCLVSGSSGSGKSSLLAEFAREINRSEPATTVIAHFAGASEESLNLPNMLTRLSRELVHAVFDAEKQSNLEKLEFQHGRELEKLEKLASDPNAANEVDEYRRQLALEYQEKLERLQTTLTIPAELHDLKACFSEFLTHIPTGRRIVLIIDGIDQLDGSGNSQSLDWLPAGFAPHVKVLVSCIEDEARGTAALRALRSRRHAEVPAAQLTRDECIEIVRLVPSLAAKALSQRQVDLLLRNPAAHNPLFLRVALDELRGFGSFEKLTDRIRSLPGGARNLGQALGLKKAQPPQELVRLLFLQVIERLETEFDAETVRTILTMMLVARHGLLERELAGLVADLPGHANVFAILRQLRPYLLNREGLLSFYHRELELAVRSRYFKEHKKGTPGFLHSDESGAHIQLAVFFAAQPWTLSGNDGEGIPALSANRRKCAELPWHLVHYSTRASDLLLDPEFLEAKAACGLIEDLADDFVRDLRKRRERAFESARWLKKTSRGRTPWIGNRREPDDAETRRLRYIEEAIRRDLPSLVKHPKCLFQTLWNALWWRDYEGLHGHCDARVEQHLRENFADKPELLDEAQKHLDQPPENLGLNAWLESWREWRRSKGDDRFWLRTLRPLPRPIGTAHRTLFHGCPVAALAAVPERRHFLSAGENIVRVWHADTGAELRSLAVDGAYSSKDPIFPKHYASRLEDKWSWDDRELNKAVKLPLGEWIAFANERNASERADEDGDDYAVRREIRSVAGAPGGDLIAVGFGKRVQIYDALSGEPAHSIRCGQEVSSLAFSPDGLVLAACDGSRTIFVWNAKTGQLLHRLEGKHEAYKLGFLANSNYLFAVSRWSGEAQPPVTVWDLKSQSVWSEIPGPEVQVSLNRKRMMWVAPGLQIETGASNAQLFEWQKDGTPSSAVSHPTNIWIANGPVALSEDGTQIASAPFRAEDERLEIIDVASGESFSRRPGHPINSLVFVDTFDGGMHVSMVKERLDDYIDDMVRVTVNREKPAWIGEKMVISASEDGTICLTPATRARPAPRWPKQHERDIEHIEFSSDGRFLISASYDSIRVWTAAGGLEHLRLTPGGPAALVSPDCNYVTAACAGGTLKTWALSDGALVQSLETGRFNCLRYSSDGSILLAGDDNGALRIWDATTGLEGRTIPVAHSAILSVAISADNTCIAATADAGGDSNEHSVHLLDFTSGEEIGRFSSRPPFLSGGISHYAHRVRFDAQTTGFVTLDTICGETNYWNLDGSFRGFMKGVSDIDACADARYPWLALFDVLAGELSIRPGNSRDRVAFLPSRRIKCVATHPNGVTFAAAEGRNLLLFQLEGGASS
ncbi:MAG: DUF4062 domain-containing protein [Rhodomicrobium sp.]